MIVLFDTLDNLEILSSKELWKKLDDYPCCKAQDIVILIAITAFAYKEHTILAVYEVTVTVYDISLNRRQLCIRSIVKKTIKTS